MSATTLPSAAAQLAREARTLIQDHREVMEEMFRMGATPDAPTVGFMDGLKTAVAAYDVAAMTAAGASLQQLVHGARVAIEAGNGNAAYAYVNTLALVLDFQGEEAQANADQVVQTIRDMRQGITLAWAMDRYGDQAADPVVRAEMFLKKAVELYQSARMLHAAATGDDIDVAVAEAADAAHRRIDETFTRDAGDLGQELGGVAVTLNSLAAILGQSLYAAESAELQRILAKPKDDADAG